MKQLTIIGGALVLAMTLATAKTLQHRKAVVVPATAPVFQPAGDFSVCPGYGWQGGLCDRAQPGSHG